MGICFLNKAQQTNIYTQYTFNEAYVNPAASGININQKYNYTIGIGRQWLGFDNAPKQNFVNVSMTLRPPRSYHSWQNVGIFVEADESGTLSNNAVYAGYTRHFFLRKNILASVGVYAGVRSYFISTGALDRMDPIFQNNNYKTILYPDVIPGLRLSNKKFFIDLALRQVSITQLKDFQGKRIGGPSKLKPTLFFAYGRKIPLSDIFVFMPSVTINSSLVGYPAIGLNAMVYYTNRMGAGISTRNLSFLNFLYQIRLLKNIAVGISYSYSLNSARYAAPSGFELMVGVTPLGLTSKSTGKHSIARCPGLDF